MQVGAFEEWPLPSEPFDLVMIVTAFHWLDPAVALPKIARALRPGGALAIAGGGHVAGGTSQFFVDAQECYLAHMPGTEPGIRQQTPDEIPLAAPASVTECGLFEPAQLRRHLWLRDFTTQTYIDELNTYSGHIDLSEENRTALLACIRDLIDTRYAGRITKAYMTDLAVARVRSNSPATSS